MTSGSSDSESVCALPRMWAWMTKTSAAAKPIASAHHGTRNPSVYGWQVAHDGQVERDGRRGGQPDEQPDGRRAQPHVRAQPPFTRRSSRCRTSCGPTSCGPTSCGPDQRRPVQPFSPVAHERSRARRLVVRSAQSTRRSSTAGWNGCACGERRGQRQRALEVHAPGAVGGDVRGQVDRAGLEQRLDLVGRRARAAPGAAARRGPRPPRRPARCRCRGRSRRRCAPRGTPRRASSRARAARSRRCRGRRRRAGGRASREENSATVSSAGSAVCWVSVAPTAIRNGSAAGRSRLPVPSARLPAAATTVMPRLPQLLGGVGERLADVRATRVDAEREVQHADVQAVRAAVAAHPVERHQDAHEAGDAVGAGDLHAHEPRVRARRPGSRWRRRCRAITPAMCEPWPNVSSPRRSGS